MKEDKLHTLELSMTVGCKIDCLYCPQKLLLKNYYGIDKKRANKLAFKDFKLVLDKVEPGAIISFCGMSEPFFNGECADMIAYAFKKGYQISLLTTLMGMGLEDFKKIKNVDFNTFVLHIPDEEMNSKFVITEEYLKLLKVVNETIDIDYYSCHGTVHHDVISSLNETKLLEHQFGNRAGNLKVDNVVSSNVKSGRLVCYHGSERQIGGWSPVMLPDGTLILCCMDYGMKHILGNLINESWEDIKNSEAFRCVKDGLNDSSLDILCRTCGSAKQVEMLPAIQIGNMVKERKCNLTHYTDSNDIITRLARAESICVFGLGKLFQGHFFQEHWNEGLQATIFVDNNKDMQGKNIKGIQCISPEQLANKVNDNVMVVIFVKDPSEIERQLMEMGINNVVSINTIFEEYSKINKRDIRQLTI